MTVFSIPEFFCFLQYSIVCCLTLDRTSGARAQKTELRHPTKQRSIVDHALAAEASLIIWNFETPLVLTKKPWMTSVHLHPVMG